jgi:hypothetical protein
MINAFISADYVSQCIFLEAFSKFCSYSVKYSVTRGFNESHLPQTLASDLAN